MTPEYAALCERLKKLSRTPAGQVQSVYGSHSINGGWTEFRRDMTDSAAAIERLSAENEALRGVRETAFRAGWRAGFSGAMQSGPLPDEDTDLNKYITPAFSLVK